jgi:hypothetical protein
MCFILYKKPVIFHFFNIFQFPVWRVALTEKNVNKTNQNLLFTRVGTNAMFNSGLMCCSSTQEDSFTSACLRGLARHFKTEPTETVALCFGHRTS